MFTRESVARLFVKVMDDTTLALVIRSLLASEEAAELDEDEITFVRKLLSDLGDIAPERAVELSQSI